jgi:hypothetical protein
MEILVDSKIIGLNNPNILIPKEKPTNHIAKYILKFHAFHQVYKTFFDEVMYNSSQKHTFLSHINYEKLSEFIEKNTISFTIDKIESLKEKIVVLFDEFHKEEHEHLINNEKFNKITILHIERQKIDHPFKERENIFLKMTSGEQKIIKTPEFKHLQYFVAELLLEHEILNKFHRFYSSLLENSPNDRFTDLLKKESISYIDFLNQTELRKYLLEWWIYDINQKTPLIHIKTKIILEKKAIEYCLLRSVTIILDRDDGNSKLLFQKSVYNRIYRDFRLRYKSII